MKIVYHGVMENNGVFQELDITESDSPLTYHDLAFFQTRRSAAGGGVRPLGRKTEQGEQKETEEDQVMLVPDPTDKVTVLTLADMSLNAYENRNTSENWKPIPGYNVVRVW